MRRVVMLAILGTCRVYGSHPDSADEPAITVRVFDYAGVSSDTFARALREAGRVLLSGGIEVSWIRCPVDHDGVRSDRDCQDEPGPLTLVVHILPRGAARRQSSTDSAGFAVPPNDGGVGTYAGIFYERVRHIAVSIGEGRALGHVIAHEIGHLLLGTGRHSARGIMTPDWGRREMMLAAQGRLRFDLDERVRMRGNLRRRILASNSLPPETTSRTQWPR
jgi:hypothetical protein